MDPERQGGGWSFRVLGVEGAAEQACEWEKTEQWSNGRVQPSVHMDIWGRASQWASPVDANVNTEQWGPIPCLTSW